MTETATTSSLLNCLTQNRLVEMGRLFSVSVPSSVTKPKQIEHLIDSGLVSYRTVVREMGRDELKRACRAHSLEDKGRLRLELQTRLLEAHDGVETQPLPMFFMGAEQDPRYFPRKGDVVRVRHRQWLVEEVVLGEHDDHSRQQPMTRVDLVCLDDDNQGASTTVLWELELGAKVLQPEAHGLGDIEKLDEPRYFGAYLHALKWNSVTATDARLFQSPFRAGVQIMQHQLTPLKRALALPRVNLFIADDVGLGKTIEAGLVLQELRLRQQVNFCLVVCPAAVTLQWKDEMAKRFGLHFELYNRDFLARRRRERGFSVNPWTTHQRFIISYQTLRRPEYCDPLFAHLGKKQRKSMLILDEAHTAAPASSSRYAVDSAITKTVRPLAEKFENRLFLSATPHNGHSNSFSSLLEILDPQRFTRGVAVRGLKQLEPVLVRRLKPHLRAYGTTKFPKRNVEEIVLSNADGRWAADYSGGYSAQDIGEHDDAELKLAEMLTEYTALMKPKKGRGKLVFINLQKRLLSSVFGFHRTLKIHAESVGKGTAKTALAVNLGDRAQRELLSARRFESDDYYDAHDEATEDAREQEDAASSTAVDSPEGRAQQLLEDMLTLSREHQYRPGAKVLALIDWIKEHQCPAVAVGGADENLSGKWADTRMIVFTEYGDSKRHLVKTLQAAIDGTDDSDNRIAIFHGGMSDEQREELQNAFNGDYQDNPVRILIATDAAREGLNLQRRCANLFHFDIPWNPARMEQRNGRIDRTLQPSPEVWCHYFIFKDRQEDIVLKKLVEKVELIQKELGSLSAVIMDQMESALSSGIEQDSSEQLDLAEQLSGKKAVAHSELETHFRDPKMEADIEESAKLYEASKTVMDFKPKLLRDAIDVGLELSGAGKLAKNDTEREEYVLPDMPASWRETVDFLRRPKKRHETWWDWRKDAPPRPVVFKPTEHLDDEVVHLHLEHPLVKRLLQRFLAQGFSAHDLSRVTILKSTDARVRVIAFGRLCLFGQGATRLHDRLISVAAPWYENQGKGHLKAFSDETDKQVIRTLEDTLAASPSLDRIGPAVQSRILASAPGDFKVLWDEVKTEADTELEEAKQKLKLRGIEEADDLKDLLQSQKTAIEETLQAFAQGTLALEIKDKEERAQHERDEIHMRRRLEEIETEIATETEQIKSLYHVVKWRLEPVGLVYLWPESRL